MSAAFYHTAEKCAAVLRPQTHAPAGADVETAQPLPAALPEMEKK